MRCVPRRLFFLTLTAIVSFLLPLVMIGSIVLGLSGLTRLALLMPFTQQVLQHLLHFLTTLGSGNAWHGVLIVGLTSSTVGVLFDTFASARFEGFSHH
ncbi:hypothetical protein [Pseudanabaena sp. FACHB-2040]|uniref:hypothetical protein n=1 Tax=Pseudanabaena sp. FACHB-2040 TaxID=2692859 RepID=UPI001685D5B6|nr:hypothetical protein [Pseudanabaena sp. FACHB-2040]MBD0266963.1 hypothetical protein [Cyanobacteria bacterium Co-bin8]MBD2259158.1 hypothetical protein [Pseudanabaena sp. FACHB-2040]